MTNNSTDFVYPLIFLFCYLSTLVLVGWIAFLVYKRTGVLPSEPEKQTEEIKVK